MLNLEQLLNRNEENEVEFKFSGIIQITNFLKTDNLSSEWIKNLIDTMVRVFKNSIDYLISIPFYKINLDEFGNKYPVFKKCIKNKMPHNIIYELNENDLITDFYVDIIQEYDLYYLFVDFFEDIILDYRRYNNMYCGIDYIN